MKKLHVVGIGHALVDMLAPVTNEQLTELAVPKGGMVLQGLADAQNILQHIRPQTTMAGGSAANTIASLAAQGATVGFAGCVGNDVLGNAFINDLSQHGIANFVTQTPNTPTGQCCILVTPDGERSMATFLGASSFITQMPPLDNTQILYIEGYLWDQVTTIDTLYRTINRAKSLGTQCAFTLSDSFCVQRHRDDFVALLQQQKIDVLFANESELYALAQSNDFETALQHPWLQDTIAVITRSEKGAVVRQQQNIYTVPAQHNIAVVDATGAGDVFAAGFLYAYTHGQSLSDAATHGCRMAAKVIAQWGARLPKTAYAA